MQFFNNYKEHGVVLNENSITQGVSYPENGGGGWRILPSPHFDGGGGGSSQRHCLYAY